LTFYPLIAITRICPVIGADVFSVQLDVVMLLTNISVLLFSAIAEIAGRSTKELEKFTIFDDSFINDTV
jgi:hypothetical protein